MDLGFTLILLSVTKRNVALGLRLGQETELKASGGVFLRFQPQIISKQAEIFLLFGTADACTSPSELASPANVEINLGEANNQPDGRQSRSGRAKWPLMNAGAIRTSVAAARGSSYQDGASSYTQTHSAGEPLIASFPSAISLRDRDVRLIQ